MPNAEHVEVTEDHQASGLDLIGFDYETHPIGPGGVVPRAVCLSAFVQPAGVDATVLDPEMCQLATRADGDIRQLVEDLTSMAAGGPVLVAHNASFDIVVTMQEFPDLVPQLFAMLEGGAFHCTKVREKMLDLADTGDLKFAELPDGTMVDKRAAEWYSLAALAKRYLGHEVKDKTKFKKGKLVRGDTDDWRFNYDALEDVPLAEWPDNAVDYSVADPWLACRIWRCQEERRRAVWGRIGHDPLTTQGWRLMLDVCLLLTGRHGVRILKEVKERIQAEMVQKLHPDNMRLLIQSGILIPAQPPRPLKIKEHISTCPRKGKCGCPPRMGKPEKESMSTKLLRQFVLDLKRQFPEDVEVRMTEPSTKFPEGQVKVDSEWLEDHHHLHPMLKEAKGRADVQKIVSTELPRMEWPKGSGVTAERAYPGFDCLKETGRTSSFGSDLLPSFNCQNVREDVRECFGASDGYWLLSVDISQMELCSLAQTIIDIFGHSTMADRINEGKDIHAWLAADLCYQFDQDFRAVCQEERVEDHEQKYLAFKDMADVWPEKYKHWRDLAKPTNLGYPGGLGPKTFIAYAWGTYRVEVTQEQAEQLREGWFRTWPEMRDYFDAIQRSRQDPLNPGRYCYRTIGGLYRANCSFCAAANGIGLQSASAEGAGQALIDVVRNTYDPSLGNKILLDDDRGIRYRPSMYVHDEVLGEARIDCAHEVGQEVARLVVAGMKVVTPDVNIKAEPVLMSRWDKKAKPKFDQAGRLVPWN